MGNLVKSSLVDRSQPRRSPFVLFLSQIGLLALSSVLFALSFPSFLSVWGWFPLAFVSIAPVFIAVHRSSFKGSFFYGALYGFVAYSLFNYWASTFHPFAIYIIASIYAFYFFLLFPILKIADVLFPKYGYLVQSLIWIAYEYLRTKGFVGYPYGNIGYSQYLFLPFIQIASVTGVWGVSYLVIFPSVFIGNAVKDGFSKASSFFREHRKDTHSLWGRCRHHPCLRLRRAARLLPSPALEGRAYPAQRGYVEGGRGSVQKKSQYPDPLEHRGRERRA
jgi:hypothetical protein